MIEGTGGLRKLRHGDPTRGKGKRRAASDLLLEKFPDTVERLAVV